MTHAIPSSPAHPSVPADPAAQGAIGASLCLALVVAMGGAVGWACLAGWLSQAVMPAPRYGETVRVAADATPVIYAAGPNSLPDRYFTLDRKPFSSRADANWLSPAMIAAKESTRFERSTPLPTILSFSDAQPAPAAWYFVAFADPVGPSYFVGYDINTRRRIGYIGKNGFQADEPTAAQAFDIRQTHGGQSQFLAPNNLGYGGSLPAAIAQPAPGMIPAWVCHVISDDRLLRVDLRRHTVETIFHAPQLVSVYQSMRPRKDAVLNPDDTRAFFEDYLAVRSGETLAIFGSTGRLEGTYHLPAELDKHWCQFFLAADGRAAATFIEWNWLRNTYSQNVIEFARDGSVSRTWANVTVGDFGDTPWKTAGFSVVIPEPIVPLLITFVFSPFNGRVEAGSYGAAISEALTIYWPMLVLTALLGLLSMGLYWRHAARLGQRPSVAWMVFTFLCGIPGYAGYWLHRRWPVRLACPSCRAQVPRDREVCIACGTPFPCPAPNGLEILAAGSA